MKVQLLGIRNPGDLKSERVVLFVKEECNIGHFIIAWTQRDEENITSDIKIPIWFADHQVKAGDYVVVYTKAGKESHRLKEDAASSHFYYFGNAKPIWASDAVTPVLIGIDNWEYLPLHETVES